MHRFPSAPRTLSLLARPLLTVGAIACGGGAGDDGPADVARAPVAAPPAPAATPVWTDRAWVRSDATDLPGRLRVFLSDGTLIQDSCWEVYRLSSWRQEEAGRIVWSEDGQEIRAEVTEASDQLLRLRLDLVDGPHEESYRPAEVPYVCPEMAR